MAKVEAQFASGEQNFKAGHLEAARREFDAAVDLMLQSGYDVERDPDLHELFRKVVDTVYYESKDQAYALWQCFARSTKTRT